MLEIYTIGFTQKSAEQFFKLLEKASIQCLIDVRLNNVSQLAGFTKSSDLKFFLDKILNVKYYHSIQFAPTKDILDNYKKNKITWATYEEKYLKLLKGRKIEQFLSKFIPADTKKLCLLCSEPTPEHCHRRLLAEYLKNTLNDDVKIIHL